jgi:hypothetical protein
MFLTVPASPGRLFVQDRARRVGSGFHAEWRPGREHLVEHAPEREDVRAVVHALAAYLLRRHVSDGPQPSARLRGLDHRGRLRRFREAPGCDQLRDPEVEDLDVAVPGDEDVGGLEVAVDDPLLVGSGESLGDLGPDLDRLARGERSGLQPLPQGLAFQ